MPTIERPSGVRITVPAGVNVLETVAPPATARRTRRSARSQSSTEMSDAIVELLERQEMRVVDAVPLEIASLPLAGSRRRGAAAPESAFAVVEVPLAPHEDAVILLEQDGLFSWEYAAETGAAPAARRGAGAPTRRAVFRITVAVAATPVAPGARRGIRDFIGRDVDRIGQQPGAGARRGIIRDFIVGQVKAIVIKFAARVAVGLAMTWLERHVRRGLTHVQSLDPAQWRQIDDLKSLGLPARRQARLLLLIHGTFSSTIGAYGALAGAPWGQKLLEGAWANYDAVIGFDHPTLSEDPLANATDLLRRLKAGTDGAPPPYLDVVVHSRGGLVIRSLLEHLLPLSDWKPRIGRVIFVAAPNAGTLLAKPDNWKDLIDLYTNLATATCKLIGMIPQAKAPTLILQEQIQGLGAFVQYCATQAVTEGQVPGLAAMEPGGAFITRINEEQPGQPTVDASYYCAITSEFEPKFDGEHEPKEFSVRLMQLLAGGFISALMKESNDLVVNTASMVAIDLSVGKYVKDALSFGKNPQVHHCNYFVRPEVCNALARWLRLIEPGPAVATTRKVSARITDEGDPISQGLEGRDDDEEEEEEEEEGSAGGRKRRRRRNARSPRRIPPPRVASPGSFGRRDTPAEVDTDILIAAADSPVRELLKSIEKKSPSYVVVNRDYRGRTLNYALPAERMLGVAAGAPEKQLVIDALNLHEIDASPTQTVGDSLAPQSPVAGEAPTRHRSVLLEGGRPIGVLPEKMDLPNADGLVALAGKTANPKKSADRILARRTMPTFNRRGPKETAPKVTCYFHAEMDGEVVVKHVTTVEVQASRELIARATGEAAAGDKAPVNPDRKLLIQAIPKKNFELKDESEGREEIDPPAPGKPQTLYFDLRATDEGDGEVWVVVRQGQVPLVTLSLKTSIVKKKSGPSARSSDNQTTAEAPRLTQPLDQLFITETQNGDQLSYRFQLEFQGLNIRQWDFSRPFKGSRTQYVENLYREIEKRWLDNKNALNNFVQELRAFGGQLFEQLFPSTLQKILWDNRAQIKNIQVISEEPFIPWELVHLKEPGKNLGPDNHFLGQKGLVRWLSEAGWPPDRLKIRKGKARYVIPAYQDAALVLPGAQQEIQFLKDRFGATEAAADSGKVRELVSQPGAFDLLHFACHGEADQNNISNARLLLKGLQEHGYEEDSLSATTVEQFANLQGADGNKPVVVLNACQVGRTGYQLTGSGGFAQAFLKAGAGAFVGTLWSVGDQPARTFTETFYEALLKQKTIAEAVIDARAAAEKAKDSTWLAYVVYGHPFAKLV
jgi:hypothetical protein